MKQTAVEWLVQQLEEIIFYTTEAKQNIIEQAKEMEKQQIENAWYAGDEDGAIHEFEQYYNETFKK